MQDNSAHASFESIVSWQELSLFIAAHWAQVEDDKTGEVSMPYTEGLL